MSAGMALNAMSTAENFALASGMGMEHATKRLADVQRALGLNSTNVEDHFRNMTKLSDSFVAIAPKVGSSVDELSGAFQSRFVGAMDAANMSVEEGIALIGALSTLGERYRGRTGGEYAARLLGVTSVLNMNNMRQWEALLGEKIYDQKGKMKPMADISDLLTERLGSLGNEKRVAQIVGAGFKSENVNLLNALIGIGPQIRQLQADLQNVGGVSAKAADMMRRTFMGQMTTLYNLAINVASVVGERLAPVLFVFTDAIASAAQWFTKLNPALQNFIVIAGLAAVAAYPLYLSLMYIGGLALAPFFMIGSAFMLIGRTAVTAAMAIARFGINVASFVASAVITAVTGTISIVKGIYSTLVTINTVVLDAFKSVVAAAMAVGNAMWHAFAFVAMHAMQMLVDVAVFLTSTFRQMMNMVKGLIGSMVSLLGTVLYHGIAAIGSMLLGILPLIVSIVSVLVMLPVIFFAAAVAATAFAAVVTTIGIGIAQFGAMIGAGIVAVWVGLKAAVAGAFAWVMDRMDKMREAASNVWSSFKGGAARALVSVGDALHKMAGFLWNFRENIEKVAVWWKANWENAIKDIGNIIVAVIESTVENAIRVFSSIGTALYMVFEPIGVLIVRLLTDVFVWVGTNWDRLWSDAGTAFRTFVSNMAHNFSQLFPLIDALANYIQLRLTKFMYMDALGTYNAWEKQYRERIALEVSRIVEPDKYIHPKEKRTFKGPFDDMGKTQTRWGDLAGRFGDSFGAFGDTFGGVGKQIWSLFGGTLDDLSPMLGKEGVKTKAPWADLFKSFNLAMPADAMGSLMNAFFGPTKTVKDASGAGELIGKGGPGWQFRQTSMARMEVGGDEAIAIEFQQLSVMQAIQRDTAVIAAANKKEPPVLKMPRPVREGGD
jgi:TP901 family phage tail tape measure protein